MYNYPYGDNQQINLNWIISEIIALHQRLDPDYTAPTFTQIYPFSDTQQLNLDWILTELKALKELAPPPSGLSSDDVLNDSTVSGDTVTDALDALLAAFGNLDSDDIANNSTVSGSTVTDALSNLNGATTATQNLTALVVTGNTAPRKIISGELVVKDGLLYVAISNISSNDTLTVNGNIQLVENLSKLLLADYTTATSSWVSQAETSDETRLVAQWCWHNISISYRGKTRSNHAVGDVLFTLPEKYRPSASFQIIGTKNGILVPLSVNTNGNVTIFTIDSTVASQSGRIYTQFSYITFGGNRIPII